jgi:hypothetical protein
MRRLKYRLTKRQRDMRSAIIATTTDVSQANAMQFRGAVQDSTAFCDPRGGVHAFAEIPYEPARPKRAA